MVRKVCAVACFLPAIAWLPLMWLEQALLDRGLLDTGDRWIISGQPGAAHEELLNVWNWDAACGLLCLLALPGILVGLLVLRGAVPNSPPQPGPSAR